MMKSSSRFLILYGIVVLCLIGLAGCTNSEHLAQLTVATDLAPNTPLTLQAQSISLSFYDVVTAPVDATGVVRYNDLNPGEYRLVVYFAPGFASYIGDSFGIGNGETHLNVITQTPPATTGTTTGATTGT